MTELKIYRAFIDIEKHWHSDNSELLVMPSLSELQECLSIFNPTLFDDGGIDAHIKDGYVVFDLVPICDYYGLDAKEIFPPEGIEN